MKISRFACSVVLIPSLCYAGCAHAQAHESQGATQGATAPLPEAGLGTLSQDDLALRIRTPDLDVRFIPLDYRVSRLLARDSWESLRSLVLSKRAAIDSVATRAGVSRPGLALVTFFAQRSNARFDPQTLTLTVRSRVLRPLGIVPFSPKFSSQQLDLRDQVTGIYLFEENLPVDDSFTISYAGLTSDDWQRKQPTLDRERARVAAKERANLAPPPDSMAATPASDSSR